MTPEDLAVRNATYQQFVALGRGPTAAEIGEACGRTTDEVLAAWRSLHDQRAVVLDGGGAQLRMVNPFSAVPTAYRVQAAGRWWYGNCAWDAFGICAALGSDGTVETSCPDCREPLTVRIRDRRPDDESLLFHCLVPARHWWDDIGFT